MWKLTGKACLSIFSAAATAAVVYSLYPAWMGWVLLLLLFGHEVGHWLAARFVGADPWLPIFIPTPIWLFGITVIDNLQEWAKGFVYLAGGFTGIAITFILLFLRVPLPIVTIALGFEVWAVTLGSDGRKYRRWRRELLR